MVVRMPTTCCVRGCKSRGSGKDSKIKYFRFPKDEARRIMWVQAIHRENFVPTNNSMICNIHFTTEDYQKRPDLVKLTNKAIPSVFINSENVKQNDLKKKVTVKSESKSIQKPVKKPFNNLSDHTYVLRLPEPESTSEKLQFKKTVDPPTFNVQTKQLEHFIDPSTICMVQIRNVKENLINNPCTFSKLKDPVLQPIKNPCQKPRLKDMESNQNSFETSDTKWREIVFAQSVTIKELRKKVKILQQKVRRHSTKLEKLKKQLGVRCYT